MQTFNSNRPKAGKAEIISFILLVLLSVAVFIAWNKEKNPGHDQRHSLIIAPRESKNNTENKINSEPVVVPAQEMTGGEKHVTFYRPTAHINNSDTEDKTYLDNEDNAASTDKRNSEVK